MRRLGFRAVAYPWRVGVIGMVIVLLSSVALSSARQLQERPHRVAQTPSPPSSPPPASPPPAPVDERVLELSLADAVHLAVQNNLDIERERYGPRIAHTDVLRERAAFDPAVGLDASISQTKVLPDSRVLTFDETTGEVTGERILLPFEKRGEVTPLLRQRIITGGNYELRFINTRLNEAPSSSGTRIALEDPRYESSLDLTLTQPLLRDFGIAFNAAPTRRAQKTEAIAHQRVIQAILDVVFRVQEGYWNLIFRIEELAARRESQKLAEDFLAENKIRVEIGTLAPIELVQAETQVKIREEDVIVAEAAVKDAEDVLKEVLNVPQVLDTWQLRIQPTDDPTFAPLSTLILEDKIEQALKARPDIIESQLDLESRRIARQEAENQRLPRLDLQALGRLSAFGGDAGGSLSDLPDARGYEWLFGLHFEYPLGNRAAESVLQRRRLELQQALVGQRVLRLTIVREIREAVRGIETAIKRVEVTRAATMLAQTQLEAEQERFRLGLSTSFEVLEFQRDLTDARSAEIQALSDYNVELARLDQRTGVLRYSDRADTAPSSSQYTPSFELPGGPVRKVAHHESGAPKTAASASHAAPTPGPTLAYAIQVGAFLQESHASRLMSELSQKGYEPYVVTKQDAKNRLWRKVCIGQFESKDRALAMQARFAAQENRDAYVILTDTTMATPPPPR